jgi:hypothetical protein
VQLARKVPGKLIFRKRNSAIMADIPMEDEANGIWPTDRPTEQANGTSQPASTDSGRLQVAGSLSVDTFTPDEAPTSAEVTPASPAQAQPSKRDDEQKEGIEGKTAHKKPTRKKWRPRWWRLFRVRRQQHMKSVVDTVFEKYSRHPEKKYLDVKELNYVMVSEFSNSITIARLREVGERVLVHVFATLP